MIKRQIPLLVMLSAGAIVSVLMYLGDYEMKGMLFILLVVLLSFYLAGVLFIELLSSFEKKNENVTLVDNEENIEDNTF